MHKLIVTQICVLCLSAVPLLNSAFVEDVLPNCFYKPSYTFKDFPLLRYQGLQSVCIYIDLFLTVGKTNYRQGCVNCM